MAVGLAAAEANTLADGLSGSWLQLHTADPGAAGTTAVATETTRKQITLSAAVAGVTANTAALTWTGIAGSQTPTHFTLWSASTAGTFRYSGTITSAAYVAGNTFEIPIGDLDIAVSTVAA